MDLKRIIDRISGRTPPLPTAKAPGAHHAWVLQQTRMIDYRFEKEISRIAGIGDVYRHELRHARFLASLVDDPSARIEQSPKTRTHDSQNEGRWRQVRCDVLRDLLLAETGNQFQKRLKDWSEQFAIKADVAP